ncbi:TIGR02186 family protein [Celeribacter sp. PS-C1]|uniref:TIGR02186 family protein n=1 Tax=Celeribacter sp. PS-C1 TaxID=2820813 RepID=UPI001C67F754|nr:TIGR02186 family protein [Celeribacter sp. PS-C1]MBW6418967.1 TIGR02186 family protein [Celeribacter sp. PS-C1]
MMHRLIALLALFLLPLTAQAEQVVAALSQTRVSVNANFDGSEILVFGAIKREAAIPENSPLDVVITVAGPEQVETIRRKDRRFGIWINVEAQVIGHTPTFYSVATTRPLQDILPPLTDSLWKITADKRILPGMRGLPAREALIRLRQNDDLYRTREGEVSLIEDTLFDTSIALPSNIVEGTYTTRIFLIRDGDVIDSYGTSINVQKVGIERWLYNLAYQNALIYGIMALAIAGIFGWGASQVFRLIRR